MKNSVDAIKTAVPMASHPPHLNYASFHHSVRLFQNKIIQKNLNFSNCVSSSIWDNSCLRWRHSYFLCTVWFQLFNNLIFCLSYLCVNQFQDCVHYDFIFQIKYQLMCFPFSLFLSLSLVFFLCCGIKKNIHT